MQVGRPVVVNHDARRRATGASDFRDRRRRGPESVVERLPWCSSGRQGAAAAMRKDQRGRLSRDRRRGGARRERVYNIMRRSHLTHSSRRGGISPSDATFRLSPADRISFHGGHRDPRRTARDPAIVRGRSSRKSATTSCASCRPARRCSRHHRLRRDGHSAARQRHPVAPQLHPPRPARPGEEPHPARPGRSARRADSGGARLRDSRRPAGAAVRGVPRARRARRRSPCRSRWLPRDARYVEKLATPDVTIADMVGDIDPIKAAQAGLNLSDELTMHYGLLPRANRGIFADQRAARSRRARFRWACSTSCRKATSRLRATRSA